MRRRAIQPRRRIHTVSAAVASVLFMAGCTSLAPPSPLAPSDSTAPAGAATPTLSPAERSTAEAIRLRDVLGLESGEDYLRELAGDPEAVRRGGTLYGFPVTEAEYTLLKARAEDSQAVAKVTRSYGTKHPESWAGQFIETEAGVVVTLFTGDLGLHRAALAKLLSLDATFDVRPATWTLVELKALDKQVLHEQDWFESIGASFQGTGVSQGSNRVEVWVGSDDPNIGDQVIAHFGAVGRMKVTAFPAPWKGGWGALRVLVRDPAGRPIENLNCRLEPDDPAAFTNEGYSPSTQETGVCWYPAVGATRVTAVLTGRVGNEVLEFGRGRITIVADETVEISITVERQERPD